MSCGIISAHLLDPISCLISPLFSLSDDEPNAVGFYLGTTIHLYNIYDNNRISWIRPDHTASSLIFSNLASMIRLYPLNIETRSSPTLLTRASLNKQVPITEPVFYSIVTDIISNNEMTLCDKTTSYTNLFLDHKSSNTGYTLVNQVLSKLMGIKQHDRSRNSNIIPCPYLTNPITMTHNPTNHIDSLIVIPHDSMKNEMDTIASVFIKLYIEDIKFRTHLLNRKNATSTFMPAFVNIFDLEKELVQTVVNGLHGGILSDSTLNLCIRELSSARKELGCYDRLPICKEPKSEISVVSDTITCTFSTHSKEEERNTDRDAALRDLGMYISHILDSFDNPDSLVINLGTLVSTYNKIVMETNLPKIVIPHSGGHTTLSRQVIATIPGDDGLEIVNIPLSSKSINIPMYNANLSALTDRQLLDILVYIDSLRDSDGSTDTRYANIQNEITHELARRKHI